jgi:SAM-dependent methyltransferase
VSGESTPAFANVQDLPFDDDSFDVAVAAGVLFHVGDLDRGLAELARVLRPGGRLVAVTNYADHLIELFELVGAQRWELSFDGANGAEQLGRYFSTVETRDASGTVTLRDSEVVRAYFRSAERLSVHAGLVPDFVEPLVARRRQAVLIAETPATRADPM